VTVAVGVVVTLIDPAVCLPGAMAARLLVKTADTIKPPITADKSAEIFCFVLEKFAFIFVSCRG
jgi:hypothetical protein